MGSRCNSSRCSWNCTTTRRSRPTTRLKRRNRNRPRVFSRHTILTRPAYLARLALHASRFMHGDFFRKAEVILRKVRACRRGGGDCYEELCQRIVGIVGIGLLTIPVAIAAGASDKPVTGDKVIRETQEAMTATTGLYDSAKDAFQRKVQTELDEMKVAHPWTPP